MPSALANRGRGGGGAGNGFVSVLINQNAMERHTTGWMISHHHLVEGEKNMSGVEVGPSVFSSSNHLLR